MKTKEELNALKEEVETVSRKLQELTEEELLQVTGGGPVLSHCRGDCHGTTKNCTIRKKGQCSYNYTDSALVWQAVTAGPELSSDDFDPAFRR